MNVKRLPPESPSCAGLGSTRHRLRRAWVPILAEVAAAQPPQKTKFTRNSVDKLCEKVEKFPAHSIPAYFGHCVADFLGTPQRFGDLAENEFLNQNVQEHFGQLHSDIKQLTTYMATHFFPMHNASRTYLYPNLNVDRQGSGSPQESAEYNRYALPLIALVRSAIDNYRAFRRTLKTELAI